MGRFNQSYKGGFFFEGLLYDIKLQYSVVVFCCE